MRVAAAVQVVTSAMPSEKYRSRSVWRPRRSWRFVPRRIRVGGLRRRPRPAGFGCSSSSPGSRSTSSLRVRHLASACCASAPAGAGSGPPASTHLDRAKWAAASAWMAAYVCSIRRSCARVSRLRAQCEARPRREQPRLRDRTAHGREFHAWRASCAAHDAGACRQPSDQTPLRRRCRSRASTSTIIRLSRKTPQVIQSGCCHSA